MTNKNLIPKCMYYGAKIFSNDNYQSYHIYKEHPDKLRKSFVKEYLSIPMDIRKLMLKEQAYKIFLETLEQIDKSKKDLT